MLSKLYKILFLINILVLATQSYAAPPPLPTIQQADNTISDNEKPSEISPQKISTFTKIKQFFYKPTAAPTIPKTTEEKNKVVSAANNIEVNEKSAEDNEPFIDLGDTKLPTASGSQIADNEFKPSNDAAFGTNLASNNIKSTPLPMTPNVPAPLVTMPPSAAVNTSVAPQSQPITRSLPPMPVPVINSPVGSNAPPAPGNVPVPPKPPVPATDPAAGTTIPEKTTVSPPATPAATPPPTSGNVPAVPLPTPTTQPTKISKVDSSQPAADSSVQTINKTVVVENIAPPPAAAKNNWEAPLTPVEVVSTTQSPATNQPPVSNKVVQQTTSKPTNQPISEKKIATTQKKEVITPDVIAPSSTKFAKDETQMLLLPNDDIVLGKLTEQATLEQMDMYAYIKIVQNRQEWLANTDRRKIVTSLIKYDNSVNKKELAYANLPYCDAIENAFEAIKKDNLFTLRSLIDVYPILQEKSQNGETLLTEAAQNDNYYLAKFLVIRGIKISALNSDCQYASDIALAKNNDNIACMITKAKGW